MKKHTKIYLEFFNIDYTDSPPWWDWTKCENPNCDKGIQDIHHLEPRGMGGSKLKDYIDNLIGLCRGCHIEAEEHESFNEYLKLVHIEIVNEIRTRP